MNNAIQKIDKGISKGEFNISDLLLQDNVFEGLSSHITKNKNNN